VGAGDGLGPSVSAVLRPHGKSWAVIVPLLAVAVVTMGLGLLLVRASHITFGTVVGTLGLLLGLLPIAYLLRARVVVRDHTITKFGLVRRVGSSPTDLITSIEPYTTRWAGFRWDDPDWDLVSHGYSFRLADGSPIFKLSRTWWPEGDIQSVGRAFGLEGELTGDSRMRRPAGYSTPASPQQLPSTGLRASTIVVVVLALSAIGLVLFWPLISGTAFP